MPQLEDITIDDSEGECNATTIMQHPTQPQVVLDDMEKIRNALRFVLSLCHIVSPIF
jgi:hypothetical protein